MIEEILNHEVVTIMREHGEKKNVDIYLVGGAIRDWMLEVKHVDFDFTMEYDPLEFIKDSPFETVQYYRKFLTLKLKYRDYTFDIARTRKEVYPKPGSLPVVSAGTLKEDAERRDFTINAIYFSILSGKFFDPFDGRKDIESKKLRVLHDKSFKDDPTRILRGIRLKHKFGFDFDEKTFSLLKQAVEDNCLHTISGDRIRNEFELIAGEKKRAEILKEMEKLNIIKLTNKHFLQESLSVDDFFLCLLSFSDMIERYNPHVTSDEKKTIKTLLSIDTVKEKLKRTKEKSCIYTICKEEDEKALKIISELCRDCKLYIDDYLNNLSKVSISITGDDLKNMGLRGKKIGEILRKLKLAKIDGKVNDEKKYIKNLLKEIKDNNDY